MPNFIGLHGGRFRPIAGWLILVSAGSEHNQAKGQEHHLNGADYCSHRFGHIGPLAFLLSILSSPPGSLCGMDTSVMVPL
ncbi:Uncharacterised protein [Mycobacteroides abscessus subsp. abscessus]|nr:Uncharacterised protein [Mycobacteroides abscessus subsp. abscessus]